MAKILIVDDDKSFATSLRDFLAYRLDGFSIDAVFEDPDSSQFASATELAIGKIKAAGKPGASYDLVITDLVIRNADEGYELVAAINAYDPSIFVILYSGSSELDRERARKLKVFGIVHRREQIEFDKEMLWLAKSALVYRESQKHVGRLETLFDPDIHDAFITNPDRLKLERNVITTCFWDLRGFSTLTRQLREDPELLIDFLAAFYERAERTIAQNNGYLDKFLGDGVMALFGLPVKNSNPTDGAISAVRAALEFKDAFDELIGDWGDRLDEAADLDDVEDFNLPRLGCGINTAPVMAGLVNPKRLDFTAFGHGVNLAARVQTVADKWPILMTRRTWKLVVKNKVLSDSCAIELVFSKKFKGMRNKTALWSVQRRP